MFQCLRQRSTSNFNFIINYRYIHRNHPGHRKKPLAVVQKHDLPDRYLPEANYPPVKPKLPPGVWSENVEPSLAWKYFEEGQKFHSLKSIQERMSVMAYSNIQQTLSDLKVRGTRWSPIHIVSSLSKTPRMLPFNQYITKTDIKVINSKTDVELNKSVDSDLYDKIKNHLKENILIFFARKKELNDSKEIPTQPDISTPYKPEVIEKENSEKQKYDETNSIIKNILNTCTSILATNESNKHLLNAQYGSNVNIKAYWKRCGFEEQSPRGAERINKDVIKFQYDDVASYQIKCDMPLGPLIGPNECLESNPDDFYCSTNQAYNPVVYKVFADHILPMQVPGHWYGDKREFNFLTVLNTTKQISYFENKFDGYREDLDNFKSMTITGAFAELTAQAYYLGFSMWKDLTYPLRGQYVLSNGQDFCFADYQLNTLNLWNPANKLKNVCSLNIPERLYERDKETSEVTIYDNTLKKLINLLVNKPVKNAEEICKNYSHLDHMIGGTRLRPYLSVQNIQEDLTTRHRLLATSLYELVKYDMPVNYLIMINDTLPLGSKPRFHVVYDMLTYDFRDIVLNYYPRDYYGVKLVERMFLRKAPKQSEKFWDLKTPVFEWANVPPPHTNNVKRVIDLQKF